MTDIDRRRANTAKAVFASSEAEVDVFKVATLIVFGEISYGVQTGSRDIEAESDATWNIYGGSTIYRGSNPVEGYNVVV